MEGVEFHFFQVQGRGELEASDGWNVAYYETSPTTEELENNAKMWIKQNSDKIPPPGSTDDTGDTAE